MRLLPLARVPLLSLSLVVLGLGCAPGPGGDDAGPSGPSWQMVLEEQPGALLSVTGTSADDVWIVGADQRDGSGPTILHYTGDGFDRMTTGDEGDLWWVAIEGESGEVWMAGDGGRVFRLPPGGALESLPAPDDTRLYGVMPFASDDVWAVGGDEQGGAGVVWRYDGTSWTRPPELTTEQAEGLVFFKVWGSGPDDVWIVGIGGAALHYDGTAFTRVELPISRPLFTVHGGGDVVIGVGGFVSGLVVEASGTSLVDKTPADAPELIGVYVSGDGHAVAVGYEGAVWHRSAAGAWTTDDEVPATFFSYHAVYEDPDGGVWAVGGFLDAEPLQQGMLAHFGEAVTSTIR